MLKQLKDLILIFVLTVSCFGQNLQIQKCWEYNEGNIISQNNASDNANSFIFFRNNGENLSLNSIDKFGKIIWSNEVGGIPISNILLVKDRIVILLRSNDGILIKTLSLETGLVIWQNKLEIEATELSNSFEILNNDNLLLVINNKRRIFFFDLFSANFIGEKKLNQIVTTSFIIKDNIAFFISQENKLVKLDVRNNVETILYQFEKKLKQHYFFSENQILLVDELNNVISFKLDKNKIDWTIKIGAGVNSISETFNTYQISSIDNYIYCVKKENGKFVWRKRTDGSSEGNLDNTKTVYISSIINGQVTLFSELKKGKTLNQVVLNEKEFFVGEPLIFGFQIILQTNAGFRSYSLGDCK